jgi:hypothetical protein
MDRKRVSGNRRFKDVALVVLVVLFSGCHPTPRGPGPRSAVGTHKVFALKVVAPEQARACLSELGLGRVSSLPDPNALLVAGTYRDLHRAGVVLDLVDSEEEYTIEILGRQEHSSR